VVSKVSVINLDFVGKWLGYQSVDFFFDLLFPFLLSVVTTVGHNAVWNILWFDTTEFNKLKTEILITFR